MLRYVKQTNVENAILLLSINYLCCENNIAFDMVQIQSFNLEIIRTKAFTIRPINI